MNFPYDLFVLYREGGDHVHLRRLLTQFFTAGRVQALEQQIAAHADELITALMAQPKADLIRDFAEQLPLRVIADLVGGNREDLAQIRAWTLDLLPALDCCRTSILPCTSPSEAMQALMAYARQVLWCQGGSDGDHLLTHLLAAEGIDGPSHEEILVSLAFMLFVGHETTVNLIGNGLHLLLGHPGQLALLRQSPELIDSAVEVLRYESPVQRLTFRTASEPFTIAGHEVRPGEQVNVMLGAANRDPTVFEQPTEFDIARSPNPHLAFGAGPHSGKALARLEGRIALMKMAEVLPRFSSQGRSPDWRRNTALRGLEKPCRYRSHDL